MREIVGHIVHPGVERLRIAVEDSPGSGGANHRYVVTGMDETLNPSMQIGEYRGPGVGLVILFQNGPIAEAGVNGITHEVLRAIVADRLASFQAGPYACAENAGALDGVMSALRLLKMRTAARMARGVEGTHQL